jgi:hypothetical protein
MQTVSQVLQGMGYYWRQRVASHPGIALFIAAVAIGGGAVLAVIGHGVLALAWVAITLAFVAGDITTLFKYARCKYCGFALAPAPSRPTLCPKCGQVLRGGEHAL